MVLTFLKTLWARPVRSEGERDTTLALALAAWLIVNSHLEAFWPQAWLAADGLLGNSLFFFMSGYGVQLSLSARRLPFVIFAARRSLRLYPAILVVEICLIALNQRSVNSSADVVSVLLWPTAYTYVRHIIPYYVLLWICALRPNWLYPITILTAATLFGAAYISHATANSTSHLVLGALPQAIWWSYYWVVTAAGALFALHGRHVKFSSPVAFLGLTVFAAYFVLKWRLVVGTELAWLYPCLLALSFITTCLLFLALCAKEAVIAYRRWPLPAFFLALSANMTFEIYLVHSALAHQPVLAQILWPANIALLVAFSLIGSVALRLATRPLQSLFQIQSPNIAAQP